MCENEFQRGATRSASRAKEMQEKVSRPLYASTWPMRGLRKTFPGDSGELILGSPLNSANGSLFTGGTFFRWRRCKFMPQHENADRARAERLFKAREDQKADAPKATADYYDAIERVRIRTQELRRLRLERASQNKLRSA